MEKGKLEKELRNMIGRDIGIYNPLTSLKKGIKEIKKGYDWWGPASALTAYEDINKILIKSKKNKVNLDEFKEINKTIKLFEKLKEKEIYKKMLLNSLKNFKRMVKRDSKTAKRYGYSSSEHYVDKDWHLMNKYRLKLLEKEAKKIGIK